MGVFAHSPYTSAICLKFDVGFSSNCYLILKITFFMGKLINLVTPLHQATKRDYLSRMLDEKVHCMKIAKQYEQAYWDGERRYGYGGYCYKPGHWKPVAEGLVREYQLTEESKVLDIGIVKAFCSMN